MPFYTFLYFGIACSRGLRERAANSLRKSLLARDLNAVAR